VKDCSLGLVLNKRDKNDLETFPPEQGGNC